MAVLQWTFSSRFQSFKSPLFSSRTHQFYCKSSKNNNADESALVWFKHDLRTDDHLALIKASQYRSLLPLYIFDHRIINRFSDETLEIALLALTDLQRSLKNQGSDLMIRFGAAESIIPELVNQVKAVDVFVEEEVEYNLCQMIDFVEHSLSTISVSHKKPQIVLWKTPFYDLKSLKELPASYNQFEKLKLLPMSPLECPSLPRCDVELDWGRVPTFDDVKTYMNKNPGKPVNNWASVKNVSAESNLRKYQFGRVEKQNNINEVSEVSNSIEGNKVNLDFRSTQRKSSTSSAFVSRNGNVVGGGTSVVLNALAAYLRYLEGTSRDDWQEVHEKLRNTESRAGASFHALFGTSLLLGIISKRRVYYEAIKYERARNAGFLSPFGYSAAVVAAAVDTVRSMEWYWLMALRSQKNSERRLSIRIWRWRGYLIQYTVVGHGGPPILLVHGFGAFLEHYRDNIYDIAAAGNSVWAITLLGFGKSEKPNVLYTELLWAELLRDFIVDVVGEPAHLIGNSIGAYFVAIVAGLWPALVKSVVLINPAGSVLPASSFVPNTEERRTSGAASIGSRLLLFYLKLSVGKIVKGCYPTNPEKADDWLINEMLRASQDPGVHVVLESIFSFNLSIPLNHLLKPHEGKVLIIQGMKDPLSKSEVILSKFKKHCNGIVIKELDAGHCPHDEQPDDVNSIIREWVVC